MSDVSFDLSVYEKFLDPKFKKRARETIPGFNCINVFPGYYYGIDSEILIKLEELYNNTTEQTISLFFEFLETRKHFYNDTKENNNKVTLGNDGILFFEA